MWNVEKGNHCMCDSGYSNFNCKRNAMRCCKNGKPEETPKERHRRCCSNHLIDRLRGHSRKQTKQTKVFSALKAEVAELKAKLAAAQGRTSGKAAFVKGYAEGHRRASNKETPEHVAVPSSSATKEPSIELGEGITTNKKGWIAAKMDALRSRSENEKWMLHKRWEEYIYNVRTAKGYKVYGASGIGENNNRKQFVSQRCFESDDCQNEIGCMVEKGMCVDAAEWRCTNQGKVVDCATVKSASPSGVHFYADGLCGAALFDWNALREGEAGSRLSKVCVSGVRIAEGCSKHTDCPMGPHDLAAWEPWPHKKGTIYSLPPGFEDDCIGKTKKDHQYCGEDGKDRCCISCKLKASAGQPPSILKSRFLFKNKKKSVCTAAKCKIDDRCRSTRGKIAWENGTRIADGPHKGKPVFSTCRHTLSWDGCMSATHTNCAVAGYDAVSGMF